MAEEQYGLLPLARTDLGYEWISQTNKEVLERFALFLERNKARSFLMDVYASGDQVFRNILIQLPRMSEVFPAEDIYIQFNRDEGRQLSFSLTPV